jgi:hypothetical protein
MHPNTFKSLRASDKLLVECENTKLGIMRECSGNYDIMPYVTGGIVGVAVGVIVMIFTR